MFRELSSETVTNEPMHEATLASIEIGRALPFSTVLVMGLNFAAICDLEMPLF